MLRSALTSRSLAILAAGFLVSQTVACTPSASGGGGSGGSNGSGGSGSGSGGNKGSGGSGTSGSGGSGSGSGGHVGSGGSGTTGSGGSGTGSGGNKGSGGSGTTGSGGSGTTGTGGSGTTGTGGSGTTGTGGSGTTGTGGSGTTGTGGSGMAGGSNGNPNCPAASSIISDFEEGTTATTINPKGGVWNGYLGMGTMTPTPVTASMTPTGIATDPGSGTCMGALHIKTTGATDYSGFGATLAPNPMSGKLSFGNAVDASSHKGIKFKIKSGSGTPPAVYFDIKTKETTPMSEGGNLSDATSSNPDTTIGLRNNRGQMLVSPWTTPAIGSDWATITVPFGTLIPRWVPAAGASNACPAPGTGVAPCQAPKFVATDVLGIEFSILPDPGFPKPSGSTVGTYDLWVDDVAWVDDDSGLPTQTGFPLSGAGSVGMCSKPTGADGKLLVTAYNLWKQTFVSGGKVIRPENGNDTVSEGIAYGMLIAVNMNDKTLFDQLYSYWKGKKGAGSSTAGLMTWCQPAGSNSCSSSGGSATDADEDAAFALIQAGKVFGGTYASDAAGLIGDIWSKDIDSGAHLPTYGSNAANSTSSNPTNPSYFAPAYYRIFATVDTANASGWSAVADATISIVNASNWNSTGLIPAWCTGGCKNAGSGGVYQQDTVYQYDSHRIPMRIGLDYCWNGTAGAQQYVMKNAAFFATNAHAGKDGIGRILDLYNPDGTAAGSMAQPNSASIIGTAAVGAMAAKNQPDFLDNAYQAVFDMVTRASLAPVSSNMTPYSYYNATVGMLTLLIMTGNFNH